MNKKVLFLLIFIFITGCSDEIKQSNNDDIIFEQTIEIVESVNTTAALTSSKSNSSVDFEPADTIKIDNSNIKDQNNLHDNLQEYNQYLSSLDKNDIQSIILGVDRFKELTSENKLDNDNLYRAYKEFYREILFWGDIDFSGEGEYWSYSDEELSQYGLERWEDDGQELVDNPFFMYETFSPYISVGLREFLKLSDDERRDNYIADTVIFISTLDEYSDSIVKWENYASKYKDQAEYKDEVISAKDESKARFMDFLNYNNHVNYGVFGYSKLTKEARSSYQRFISLYPDSSYTAIIKKYCELLKENDFSYNEEVEDYLKENDLYIEPSGF